VFTGHAIPGASVNFNGSACFYLCSFHIFVNVLAHVALARSDN